MEFLKRADPQKDVDAVIVPRLDDEDEFEGIRCPLCSWKPSRVDTWRCCGEGTPEPPFEWCGTNWNTFTTGGRCPGCTHQWQWTSCLRCHGWSLHDDWYECG